MVAIFTGAGAGLERGSGSTLGGMGLLGGSSLGRGGEQLFVNAANGNLLISRQDEFLVGRGPDIGISRTYNSLADTGDDNNDNWRQSTDRRVFGLTGTLDATGSTIKRVSGDGSVITYTWDGAKAAYIATDGSGAHDKLTHASGVWTWTDGSSQITESYVAYGAGSWRISTQSDTDGNALTFSYTGANLTRITTANGEYIDYTWSGTNIASIVTQAGGTLTQTRYAYDSLNRLTTVTVDLTPEDNSIADGEIYVTAYTYDGMSTRVASISQTDGSSVAITYDAFHRVRYWAMGVGLRCLVGNRERLVDWGTLGGEMKRLGIGSGRKSSLIQQDASKGHFPPPLPPRTPLRLWARCGPRARSAGRSIALVQDRRSECEARRRVRGPASGVEGPLRRGASSRTRLEPPLSRSQRIGRGLLVWNLAALRSLLGAAD